MNGSYPDCKLDGLDQCFSTTGFKSQNLLLTRPLALSSKFLWLALTVLSCWNILTGDLCRSTFSQHEANKSCHLLLEASELMQHGYTTACSSEDYRSCISDCLRLQKVLGWGWVSSSQEVRQLLLCKQEEKSFSPQHGGGKYYNQTFIIHSAGISKNTQKTLGLGLYKLAEVRADRKTC